MEKVGESNKSLHRISSPHVPNRLVAWVYGGCMTGQCELAVQVLGSSALEAPSDDPRRSCSNAV